MSTPRLRWRPELFAALGAAFTDDPTLKDGTHLRWFSDARLGMALHGTRNDYQIFRLQIKETSIQYVDLFNPSTDNLPVHSSASQGSAGSIKRTGDTLSFQRRSDDQHWSSLRQYFAQRQLLALSATNLTEKDRALLDYSDGVMDILDKQVGSIYSAECEQVVAVDVQFGQPVAPPFPVIDRGVLPINRRPDLNIALARDRLPTDLLTPIRELDLNAGLLRPWLNRVHARVVGYDDCDRKVASDWVGWVSGDGWRLTARLRAPGISRVKIIHLPVLQKLRELETRWVFCDEYAGATKLWSKPSHVSFDPDPNKLSAEFLKKRVFAAFNTSRDWSDLASRIRDNFLNNPSFKDSLLASDTFASFVNELTIEDVTGTQPGDPEPALPLLPSLLATAIDPAVANLLGLHTYIAPGSIDGSGLDWKIEAGLPFFDEANLQSLELRLHNLQPDSGLPFFHTPENPLTELRLAGLVLNTIPGPKPPLPQPNATARAASMVIASEQGGFSQLVNATIETGGPKSVLVPWKTPACYEVIRSLTGEPSRNVVNQDEPGPLDDFGVIPDVVLPLVDEQTCLTTGEVMDVFSVPADRTRELVYDIRAFDIFGRPSAIAMTPSVILHPPCRVPATPNLIESQVLAEDDQLSLQVLFAVPQTIHSSIHALPTKLAITLLAIDAADASPPDQLRWPAAIAAKQVEFAYETNGDRINTAAFTSCQLAHWNGDDLELVVAPESTCSVRFPGTVTVAIEDNAGLPNAFTGMAVFRLIVPLGSRSLYPEGTNAWAIRAYVIGNCPIDNTPLNSAVAVNKATYFNRPAPPPLRQPFVTRLPLATRPDHLGKSYFSIDLRDFLEPANQSDDSMVKVFLVRLDRLTVSPEDFVTDGNVLDMNALITLAHDNRERFSLITDPPERYSSAQPRFDIPVPGNLAAVYVAAVVGTTPFLEESRWRETAITTFRTPPRVNVPVLSWETARIGVSHRGFFVEHKVIARFSEPLQDPTQVPRLQVMRRSLSISMQPAQYLVTVEGTSDDALASEPVFSFSVVDQAFQSWQRYEYSGQLLVFIEDRDQHVRVGDAITRLIDSPWDRVSSPFERFVEPLQITPHTSGGFQLEATFDPGEFDLTIQKVTDAGVQPSVSTVIRAAQVMDTEHFDLDPKAIYTLKFHDDDTQPGTYVLRLALGQQRVWATRAQTP